MLHRMLWLLCRLRTYGPLVHRSCVLGVACWLTACGADAGYVVQGAQQPFEDAARGLQALEVVQAVEAEADASPRPTHGFVLNPPPDEEIEPQAAPAPARAPAAMLSPYATVDVMPDAARRSLWPKAHVRCDGIFIAPGVVLSAAHCFAWHRDADSEAPPLAHVRVRSAADASSEHEHEAIHVAIHPRYPALACSQPPRSAAAACLRAAGRCLTLWARDASKRSACLQGISEQVIEAQQHASYDLALVFVRPTVPDGDDAPRAYAPLARLQHQAPARTIWLSEVDAGSDAWPCDDARHCMTPRGLPWAQPTRTFFDLYPRPTAQRRVFDAAFAAAPKPHNSPALVAWASREVLEEAARDGVQAVRYTRLEPHLIWIVDTVEAVQRVYPGLRGQLPEIIDVP